MSVLANADVRGFYEALGIDLPGWSQREAPVRCFAAPDMHAHGDRSPSTSINLESGAWCCHGCGAGGGAYDAALAVGHSPRSAIELMITHGLIEPRGRTERDLSARAPRPLPPHPPPRSPVQLDATEDDLRRWEAALSRRPALLARLALERGWRYPVMRELGLGLDATGRLTIPIRGNAGELRGVLRYQPWHTHGAKMLAARGTRLGLVPNPEHERSRHVVLVEGPPDMIAARSHGLPAIAVPGTQAWRKDWGGLFAGRHVTVIMDCDPAGRDAARRIEADLRGQADVRVVDLAPTREDGYDLSDALLERRGAPGNLRAPRRAPERQAAPDEAMPREIER